MATQGSHFFHSIFLFTTTFFYLHLVAIATGYATIAPAPSQHDTVTKNNDVIREYCGHTLIPDNCFSFFSLHKMKINDDPDHLIGFSASKCITKARDLASYIANLTADGTDSGAASGLHDCSSKLKVFIDQIRYEHSRNELQEISNMKKWLNSGLTNFDSCMKGSEGVKDDAIKAEIANQVMELKKLSGFALAFVNKYANQPNV